MGKRSEFTVDNEYQYNRSNAIRWIFSHIWRYKFLFLATTLFYITAWSSYSMSRILISRAADEVLNPVGGNRLLVLALGVLAVLVLDGLVSLGGSLSIETIAQRLERDSREELYISLLGKSQTFHDQQRVGDIMARATDDVKQLNGMMNPGVMFIFDTVLGLAVPLFFLSRVRMELLLVPLIFVALYIITVRHYFHWLDPVIISQREAFGTMNAGLEETISGIEVVKASAQENFERKKFEENAHRYRDYFAQQGRIEARYLPMLLYGFTVGLTLLHAMLLYQRGQFDIPGIIAVMGLVGAMQFPVFISIFSLSLVNLGVASAKRLLDKINAKADLDENLTGHSANVKGSITFEDVSFGYEDGMILEGVSFHVEPGETVAIVGQTGSGKSTLTELINRTYDANKGRILIDGIDVRDWQLDSLRSQISKIEQDVFLFSRTLAENIAFGYPSATQEAIETVAQEAQAHEFILSFKDGYQTDVGGRGVTLSGGQRQRIALARAFLSDPRILILDDSTSAIDSATEDEIQKAIRRAQQNRTTLLITHRLSQIRWADHILVLDAGKVVASGSHEDLLRTSVEYRRIFARYDTELPPLEQSAATADGFAQKIARR